MNNYDKYFKGPNLKEAKVRTKNRVDVKHDAYYLPNEMVGYGKGKTYHLATYGCQANERDSETISGILETMGYTPNDDIDTSDLIILNTCAIRENAEDKVFGKIGYVKNLKKYNPDIILGVCGCMPQEESVVNKILTKHQHVDLVFGTHNINNLPVLLQQAIQENKVTVEVLSTEGDIYEDLPAKRANKYKAWVNIMYGCNKFCTYCIVPYTRGKERSRLPEDIIKEVSDLVEDGYQEVTLLGQNVNSYGNDLEGDYDFGNLIKDVAKTNIPRIRFTTSHPHDFTFEMVDALNSAPNIMPYIHLPVQSGNSEILKLMGRKYTREEYLKLFNYIRETMPSAAITTDIIVGFPNETDEQFEDTLSLYDMCEYDLAYTFIYSPREGTPAAKMTDNVDLETKSKRLQRLNDMVNEKALKANLKFVGKTVKVLVDGPSKRNEKVMSGYTEQNKLVNFPAGEEVIGKIVDVKIVEAKTWTLTGELVG